MSKPSKIAILNSRLMTSPKQAVDLMRRKRARYVDEQTIELLVEADQVAGPSASTARHSPTPGKVVPFRQDAFLGQTWLRYPQKAA
jgi:hypothetical protein